MMPFGKKLEQLREEALTYIKWKLDENKEYILVDVSSTYDIGDGDDFQYCLIKRIYKQDGNYFAKIYVSIIEDTMEDIEIGDFDLQGLCDIADAIQFYGMETFKDQIDKNV